MLGYLIDMDGVIYRGNHLIAGAQRFISELRDNDVVLQVDGVAIRNDNHLINLISMLPAGLRVRLQVWRERQTLALDAEVGDWARAATRFRASAGP